jgi:Transposase DDE domain
LFPIQPTQSRFNRRRALMNAFNILRQTVLRVLDLSADGQCAIDWLPVPVVKFHLVLGSTGDWAAHGADFGKVASKKITIFGFKLHLLVSLDFELAPISAADRNVGAELLTEHRDMTVFGGKGYISTQLARQLLKDNRLKLRTLPRRNQANQPSKAVTRPEIWLYDLKTHTSRKLADDGNVPRWL